MTDWLFFIYRVPREPTSSRVYAWRKLKQLGAILLHDSVWILPATDRTQEQLQWLAEEIRELHGESTMALAKLLRLDEDRAMAECFRTKCDKLYEEIVSALKKKNYDLAALARKYQQAQAIDYFHTALGERARKALLAAPKDE